MDETDYASIVKFAGYLVSGVTVAAGALAVTMGTLEKIAHEANKPCTAESKLIMGGVLVAFSIGSYICTRNYDRINAFFDRRLNRK